MEKVQAFECQQIFLIKVLLAEWCFAASNGKTLMVFTVKGSTRGDLDF